MAPMFALAVLLYSAAAGFFANSFLLIRQQPLCLWLLIPAFLLLNLFAGTHMVKSRNRSLRICSHGTVLLLTFCVSVMVSVGYQLSLAFRLLPEDPMGFVWSLAVCFLVNLLLFWNGILCVYLTSTQLGFKLRIAGILCGMIPVVNVIVLIFILKTTWAECLFEAGKEQLDRQRSAQQLCATRYPIVLVHGVFFRDSKYFNYWGRIPATLEANGARIFYGNQASAASVADSALQLKARILDILAQTGAEKVNLIAHSKGGLDCRYAIAHLGIEDKVASLTTVNTPHRGCLFADYLLEHIPARVKDKVATAYDSTLRKFGEANADFLAAVSDLTDSSCRQRNEEMPLPQGILCQSIGSVMPRAAGGKFPLNYSYHLVRLFEGENDGLVSERSFQWGQRYILLRPVGKRGISHGDMIDLNRENIRGFDVREFYVGLVNGLKKEGL